MTSPLRYQLARLRQGTVEPQLWDDTQILVLFNEAYRAICERSACLRSIATLSVVAGTVEYTLPSDHAETLAVFAEGVRLEELVLSDAFLPPNQGFYSYDGFIGISPTPTAPQTIYLHYGRRPAPFVGLDDVPEDGFPLEYHYLLTHYVRWRRWTEQGGAQHIVQARWERDQYDQGIVRLRKYAATIDRSAVSRFVHVTEAMRPRLKSRLEPSVDAR